MTAAEDDAAAAAVLSRLEEGAWAAAAFAHLVSTGAIRGDTAAIAPTEEAAARVLAAIGFVVERDGSLVAAPGTEALLAAGSGGALAASIRSSWGQMARLLGLEAASGSGDDGWGSQSEETLRAQGRSSAMGGTMLAQMAVPALEGLAERFAGGGDFLDVGVGVGELTAAFCEALPRARVVGLDVLPKVLAIAAETVRARGIGDRVELRHLGVQDLDDVDRFDLAWLPAPFIPERHFSSALDRLARAVRPGGWLVVGAGRFEGDELAVAVTRWRTELAGGTALAADEARSRLAAAGFGSFTALPSPPGAPAVYAARR